MDSFFITKLKQKNIYTSLKNFLFLQKK